MPIDIQQRLNSIGGKASVLVDRCRHERELRLEAEAAVAEREREINRLNQRVAELNREVELLKTARLTAPTRDDVETSRALLSGLVRDIDRCIADLTE